MSINYTPNHPLFKTRLCRHWLKGYCKLGDAQCNFKHGWVDKPVDIRRSKSVSNITSSIKWGVDAIRMSKSAPPTLEDDDFIQDFVIVEKYSLDVL